MNRYVEYNRIGQTSVTDVPQRDYLAVFVAFVLSLVRTAKFRTAALAIGTVLSFVIIVGVVGGIEAGVISLSFSLPILAFLGSVAYFATRTK